MREGVARSPFELRLVLAQLPPVSRSCSSRLPRMSVFAASQAAQSDRPPTTSLYSSLNSTPVQTVGPPPRAYEDLCKVRLGSLQLVRRV